MIGDIKGRLGLGIACYLSVQNLRSSLLLFKNINIKIYNRSNWRKKIL
jgi:hypothetical protein